MLNKKIDINKIMVTSKMTLKLSCLAASNNDIDKAEKLYKFLSSDLTDIPDMDPVKLSGFQQVKQGADEVLGWINEHQDDIIKGINLVQGLRPKVSQTPVSDVAPIPKL